MTNLEAKEKLYMEWQKLLDYSLDYAGISEAYKMAFKALELEPCADVVSRQAVLDLAEKGVLVSNGNYKSVCKAINELPPVNPQVKIGHWIDLDEKSAVCSCCNRNNTLYGDFCKWCGARMFEPQESEK